MVLNPRLRFRLHGCTLLVHNKLMCEHVCAVHLLPSGLLAVRGAEVVEVRDEEGGLMNDFTGRVRLEDRKPPKGECGTSVLHKSGMDFLRMSGRGAGKSGLYHGLRAEGFGYGWRTGSDQRVHD